MGSGLSRWLATAQVSDFRWQSFPCAPARLPPAVPVPPPPPSPHLHSSYTLPARSGPRARVMHRGQPGAAQGQPRAAQGQPRAAQGPQDAPAPAPPSRTRPGRRDAPSGPATLPTRGWDRDPSQLPAGPGVASPAPRAAPAVPPARILPFPGPARSARATQGSRSRGKGTGGGGYFFVGKAQGMRFGPEGPFLPGDLLPGCLLPGCLLRLCSAAAGTVRLPVTKFSPRRKAPLPPSPGTGATLHTGGINQTSPSVLRRTHLLWFLRD